MMRNLFSASGRGVARALHMSLTASATSNFTRIIVHLYAEVVISHLHGLTRLIVIVRSSFVLQFVLGLAVLIRLHFFSAF